MPFASSRCLVGLLGLILVSFATAAPISWPVRNPSDDDRVQVRSDATGAHAVATATAPRRNRVGESPQATATLPSWAALGPFGGSVADAAWSPRDPQVALAAVATQEYATGGLYRSVDGGTNWTSVATFGSLDVNDIEFAASGRAWIATSDGVWDSVDDGVTWTRHELGGMPGFPLPVFDVALDPSNSLGVWAGVDDGEGSRTNIVMRSIDGGVTWTNVTPPLTSSLSARAIAVSPLNSNQVVVVFGGAFGGGQVWLTNDRGSSWTNRSAGLPANPMRAVVHLGSQILVAGGQLFGQQNVGLYSSTNQGQSWTPLHNGDWPTLVVEDVFVNPASPSTIWVAGASGVHRTTNGGATWQIGVGFTSWTPARSFRQRPGSLTNFMLGTDGSGVMQTTNAAATFVASTAGIAEVSIAAVDVSPLDSSRVAVASNSSNSGVIYTSTNGGATWTLELAPPTRYRDVKFGPDGRLFALSVGPSNQGVEGVYVRESNGNWTALGPDVGPEFETNLFALHVDAQGLIVASGADFGSAGFEGAIWRLPPGGSWTRVYESATNREVDDIEVVADGGGRAFLATWTYLGGPPSTGGMLRSSNDGQQWVPVTAGLPAVSGSRDGRLCRLPGNPETLVHAVTFGTTRVYRSIDAGQSWQATGFVGTQGSAHDLGCDPSGSGTVLLLPDSGPAVLRSGDGGTTFSPFDNGLIAGTVSNRVSIRTPSASRTRAVIATTKGAYGIDPNPPLFADGFENP